MADFHNSMHITVYIAPYTYFYPMIIHFISISHHINPAIHTCFTVHIPYMCKQLADMVQKRSGSNKGSPKKTKSMKDDKKRMG